jgi:hypothetical protein
MDLHKKNIKSAAATEEFRQGWVTAELKDGSP